VEYPVGQVPQEVCPVTKLMRMRKLVVVASQSDISSQTELSESSIIRVYYAAGTQLPTDYAPGSVPEFLENTIELAAGGYALFEVCNKQEHQAAADLALSDAALVLAATTFHV